MAVHELRANLQVSEDDLEAADVLVGQLLEHGFIEPAVAEGERGSELTFLVGAFLRVQEYVAFQVDLFGEQEGN